jgi:homocitrate synthase
MAANHFKGFKISLFPRSLFLETEPFPIVLPPLQIELQTKTLNPSLFIQLGVNRVGIADTVGCANPRQVYELVRTLRGVVSCDIECHFHNDTGCAIANAYAALEAGATHIDTSILGIGERNGITPLGGLCARMYVADKDYVKSKYKLEKLRDVENLVAEAVQVQVPFNNYVTGWCAFTHKAGIHAKAILNNPSTYEILKPDDFGMTRYVSIGHRLTGWNAVKNRVEQLGLQLTDAEVKQLTAQIKTLADIKPLGVEEVDTLLRNFHDKINGTPKEALKPSNGNANGVGAVVEPLDVGEVAKGAE